LALHHHFGSRHFGLDIDPCTASTGNRAAKRPLCLPAAVGLLADRKNPTAFD